MWIKQSNKPTLSVLDFEALPVLSGVALRSLLLRDDLREGEGGGDRSALFRKDLRDGETGGERSTLLRLDLRGRAERLSLLFSSSLASSCKEGISPDHLLSRDGLVVRPGETQRSLGGVGSVVPSLLSVDTDTESFLRVARLNVRVGFTGCSGVMLLELRWIGVGGLISKLGTSSSAATSTMSEVSNSSTIFLGAELACLTARSRFSSAGSMVSMASRLWTGGASVPSSHSMSGDKSWPAVFSRTSVGSLLADWAVCPGTTRMTYSSMHSLDTCDTRFVLVYTEVCATTSWSPEDWDRVRGLTSSDSLTLLDWLRFATTVWTAIGDLSLGDILVYFPLCVSTDSSHEDNICDRTGGRAWGDAGALLGCNLDWACHLSSSADCARDCERWEGEGLWAGEAVWRVGEGVATGTVEASLSPSASMGSAKEKHSFVHRDLWKLSFPPQQTATSTLLQVLQHNKSQMKS